MLQHTLWSRWAIASLVSFRHPSPATMPHVFFLGSGEPLAAHTTEGGTQPMQPATPAKRRVLVVDDDPDLLATIRQGLQLLGGYDVEVASDGIAGLEAFFATPVDCMVVDLSMPGLNGYQLIRALRGDATTAQAPIVVLSALAQEQVETIGLLSGADAYLYKPVDLQTLIYTVERSLTLTAEQRLERDQALAEGFFPPSP